MICAWATCGGEPPHSFGKGGWAMPSYRCEKCGTRLETEKRPGEAEACPICSGRNVVAASAFARFFGSLRERRLRTQAEREQAWREREAKARLAHAAETTGEPDQQEPPPPPPAPALPEEGEHREVG